MTNYEVTEARKTELMTICKSSKWHEKLDAIKELGNYSDDDSVKSLIKSIALNENNAKIRRTACDVGHKLGVKYKGKLISYNVVQKSRPQPRLRQLVTKIEIENIIRRVHHQIVSENIQYDNHTAFKTFAQTMERHYPQEFNLFAERFTNENGGLRHYFERIPVYNELFIKAEELSLQEKIFRVFDAQRVGSKVPKLKYRQLEHCKKTFHKLYPVEWQEVHEQCGGQVCSSGKFEGWLQEQYRAYKKRKLGASQSAVKADTPPTNEPAA